MVLQEGKEFQAKKNHVWTCAEGTKEGARNAASAIAVMRNCQPADRMTQRAETEASVPTHKV